MGHAQTSHFGSVHTDCVDPDCLTPDCQNPIETAGPKIICEPHQSHFSEVLSYTNPPAQYLSSQLNHSQLSAGSLRQFPVLNQGHLTPSHSANIGINHELNASCIGFQHPEGQISPQETFTSTEPPVTSQQRTFTPMKFVKFQDEILGASAGVSHPVGALHPFSHSRRGSICEENEEEMLLASHGRVEVGKCMEQGRRGARAPIKTKTCRTTENNQ